MNRYIVSWNDVETVFLDSRFAIRFADQVSKGETNSYVWVEINGVREQEPFIRNEG